MPGRGANWRGVGKGNQDRIGSGEVEDDSLLSEDIKDGTIKEVDLDSALQAKVNASDGVGYDEVLDEGSSLPKRVRLDFKGAGVVATDGIEDTTTVTIAGGGGHNIEDEGTPLATQPDLNFVGAGVTATDTGGKTVVTIPGAVGDGTGYDTVEDEGTPITQRGTINFTGDGVSANDDSENTNTIVLIPGKQIQDEGSSITQRPVLNFVGAGVTASDIGGKSTVTIPGGGGGITRELVANPATDLYLYDEFFYPTPATYLDVHYEKAGTFSAVVDAIGGQVQFQTTAVANNVARINTCGGGLLAIDVTKNWRFAVRLRQQTVTVNTAMLISIYQNDGSPPGGTFPFATNTVTSIEIRADGTGNYFATTDNNVTPQSTDTGVTIDTSFHTFEIRSNPATPSIEFLIDENIVATFTTNLPTGSKSVFIGVQTGTTSFARANVDTLFLYQDR